MNKHEINQAQLNGSVTHNAIVGLGSATATIDFIAFERALTLLSGSSAMSFSVLGDITKSAQIGTATAGITFSQSAALTVFREVRIPSASANVSFTQTAGLFNQKQLPNAAAAMSTTADGDLFVVTGLSASTSLSFNVSSASGPQVTKQLGAASSLLVVSESGSLTQYIKRTIPLASSDVEFEVDGSLTKHVKQYMPIALSPMVFDTLANLTRYGCVGMSGSLVMAFTETANLSAKLQMTASSGISFSCSATITNKRVDLPAASASLSFLATGSLYTGRPLGLSSSGITLSTTGNLSTIQKLSGSTGINFSESANIFNNPNATDPPFYVMTRPFVDRVMVRQS